MHNHKNMDINLKNISKIEGHTHLDVKVKDGKVQYCKLKISENKRFFTQAVIGLPYQQVPTTMSRICGTCSSAHTLCSIEAIEKALKLDISEQTFKLRNLLAYAGHLRDHAMHLYFFCLPDIFKKDSVFDFKGKEKEYIHDSLHIKEAGNFLSTIVGGRAVHPPNAVIGGFTKFPTAQEIRESIKKLRDARERILKIIEIFYNDNSSFIRKTNYVALINNDYSFLKGYIKTALGTSIFEEQYGEHLQRVVLPYSTATAFKWESKDYMVGALARMNLNKQNLHTDTLKNTFKYVKIFPSDSVFHNNLAQAIEMLHEVDSSIEILRELEDSIEQEAPIKPKIKAGTGIGVVEAPRGTLYYHLDLNNKGIITHANLCIPTQQNIIHLEKDIAKYVEQLIAQKKSKETISFEIEKMIRAYDPCMSCATHFLRINWS
ncbi:MAG: nickel-dependent hydrogenase large subunit [Candidatus Nanoarchaeia archaeon]|nr:nickel-dependent hydrogenase large subunit [Candidatus Nanoarchaeia archaeon]